MTKKPHVHAELIKAWADGAEIQECVGPDQWWDDDEPSWYPTVTYRIKPEPKPDVVVYARVVISPHSAQPHLTRLGYLCGDLDNVRFVFDGETLMLKSAEVLK